MATAGKASATAGALPKYWDSFANITRATTSPHGRAIPLLREWLRSVTSGAWPRPLNPFTTILMS